jgi:riboflavin kinase/FMN adenylyltransferase
VAVTFDRHPSSVLAPDQAPPLVYPLEKRLEVLRDSGMRAALLLHFDLALSRVAARDFIGGLAEGFGRLASVSVGANFAFGHRRAGDLRLLQEMSVPLGFQARDIQPVLVAGEAVSSTRLRDAIRAGRFDLAGDLLGRPYSLVGRVVSGDQLGRRIGFPTANLDVSGLVTPPPGVYAARVCSGSVWHAAAVNIGHRPTVASPESPLRVEAHLLDFEGDLAGSSLELVFLAKTREEIKFPSLEALQARIRDDIAFVRGFF